MPLELSPCLLPIEILLTSSSYPKKGRKIEPSSSVMSKGAPCHLLHFFIICPRRPLSHVSHDLDLLQLFSF